jgi:hypothetical protein
MMMLIIVAVLWWTFSVVLFAWIVSDTSHNGFIAWAKTITLAIAWPLFAPFVVIALIYQGLVVSTSQLRKDLDNRKLLREFEDWLENKKQD